MVLPEEWLVAGGRIRVVAARADEMPVVAAILDEASAWLAGRGLTGWPRPLPVAVLEAALALGPTYLAWDAPTAAGPTAEGETAAGETAAGPIAAGPTAAGPIAAGQTAAGTTAAGPTAAGTFSLHRTDVRFWGERPNEPPGRARYLHKLAVRRSHPGLGRELLALAERLACEGGAACLRLDCVAANPGIRAYYEAVGFQYRGEVSGPAFNVPYALYEKPLE
jgi:GNAT superfamily N-acetyltransferase